MRIAKIPRAEAETFRKRLARRRMVRKDRRIVDRDGYVFIPILDTADDTFIRSLGGEIIDGDAEERSCFISPFEKVCQFLHFSPEMEDLLPRKWEKVGDVLVLRLPDELLPRRKEIGSAYARAVGVRVVLQEIGKINGIHRTPEMEVLFGQGTETVHFENGLYYKLDAANLMFSSGNIDEKLRMAALDCHGETVVDMFAGIGYWTLPFAVHAHADRVIACEINPLAHHYLVENIALNHVEDIVQPILGDNRDLPGEGFADRVMMGYVRTTHQFLEKAFSLVKPGGILHYQDTFPLAVYPQEAFKRLERASGGRRLEIAFSREVKSYSPGVSHMVLDVHVLD
ncbi:MAG: class I SAM-dependent methyltransferase family protein [Euryarchaeota archaeon]|nr:class I SAM-dependent methyltransferase family protein [Euryarchaeota archaeon]